MSAHDVTITCPYCGETIRRRDPEPDQVPSAVDAFVALDPILLSEMGDERTTISVNSKALHDLMTAYQIRQMATSR